MSYLDSWKSRRITSFQSQKTVFASSWLRPDFFFLARNLQVTTPQTVVFIMTLWWHHVSSPTMILFRKLNFNHIQQLSPILLSLRVFRQLSSSSLLYSQCFGRCVIRPMRHSAFYRCFTLNEKDYLASSQKFRQKIFTHCWKENKWIHSIPKV